MTFCGFKECEKFDGCVRALTEEVETASLKWAASFHNGDIEKAREQGPGVCYYVNHPECFKEETK